VRPLSYFPVSLLASSSYVADLHFLLKTQVKPVGYVTLLFIPVSLLVGDTLRMSESEKQPDSQNGQKTLG